MAGGEQDIQYLITIICSHSRLFCKDSYFSECLSNSEYSNNDATLASCRHKLRIVAQLVLCN